jgi:hypothetical protein
VYKIEQLTENFAGDKTFASAEAKDTLLMGIMTDLKTFKQCVVKYKLLTTKSTIHTTALVRVVERTNKIL